MPMIDRPNISHWFRRLRGVMEAAVSCRSLQIGALGVSCRLRASAAKENDSEGNQR